MYNYRTYTKAQLIELVNAIESSIHSTLTEAEPASKEHSPELISQLAFETGYLKGGLKTVLLHIESAKEYSK
jgi:hypothetical protein